MALILVVAVCLLVSANGANDNGKAMLIGGNCRALTASVVFAAVFTFLDSTVAIPLASAVTVLAATRIGMLISTTRVSCGSLFGIGLVNGKAHGTSIGQILLAWHMLSAATQT